MTNGLDTKLSVAADHPKRSKLSVRASRRYRLLSLLFGGQPVRESVATRLHIEARLETVWRQILFYEEIPGSAPLLLRALIPRPVRTEGDKTRKGALIVCIYKKGNLVKRITSFEELRLIEFQVIEQRLGIESCVVAKSGAYKLCPRTDGVDAELTTNYQACLYPRWFWRPLEKVVVQQLHRHILSGMRAAVAAQTIAVDKIIGCMALTTFSRGDEVCTSQSHSHR